MTVSQTIDEYVEREIAAFRSGPMQVAESYSHPLLAKTDENRNKSLIEEIEASLKAGRRLVE